MWAAVKETSPAWNNQLFGLQVIMFPVDVMDYSRFDDVRTEIHALLSTKELSEMPLIVLENKCDARSVVSQNELRYRLDLHQAEGSERAPY